LGTNGKSRLFLELGRSTRHALNKKGEVVEKQLNLSETKLDSVKRKREKRMGGDVKSGNTK